MHLYRKPTSLEVRGARRAPATSLAPPALARPPTRASRRHFVASCAGGVYFFALSDLPGLRIFLFLAISFLHTVLL